MILLKKVCAFLLAFATLSTSPHYTNVDRSKLSYEVLSIRFSDDEVIIDGWGLIPDVQHYNGVETHGYALEVVGKSHAFTVSGQIKNRNLTRFFDFKGWKACNKGAVLVESCNYEMKNVGFEFRIKLSDLKVDEDYKLYLMMHAKQANLRYRIPLFYVEKNELIKSIGNKNYTIFSSYKHTKFNVITQHHYTRSLPSPQSEPLRIGNSCSSSHGNTAYFKYLTVFSDIRDIVMYEDLVTYFKVPVEDAGCSVNRKIVSESKDYSQLAYIPSTGINYLGNPTTIMVRKRQEKPNLLVEDVVLYENDPYNPFDYAQALDSHDGNISHKIEVISSNVNISVPGVYQTCYFVRNSFDLSMRQCGSVTILKRPRRHRYISKYSIHNTRLNLWSRVILKDLIRSDDIKSRIVIKR